ncbi:MAG TPA: hypothetical protein VF291_01745, partial [Burkholderiaceae bacterium]
RRLARALGAGAPASEAEHAKTVAVPRAPAGAARADTTTAMLIEDIDVFAKGFERQQQETLRAEAEERERKEEAIRRWAEAEAKRREAFEREREAKSGATQAGTTRRSAAFELLKQKTAGRSTAASAEQAKKNEAIERIDERLRAAFRYLAEFTNMLNEAHPVSDASQGVMFFGNRPGMILCEGFTDMRTREVAGKSRADYVTFKYRVRFAAPERLSVTGPEIERFQERLKALGIRYDLSNSKSALGYTQSATFELTGPFPCQAVIRADYDEPGFNIELVNVRKHGPAKLRLGADELNDEVIDEFGTWVLGADESFERFLKRHP